MISTVDGGKTWEKKTIPGAEKLDFRDIKAFDKNTAYVMSVGSSYNSCIYKTTDTAMEWYSIAFIANNH